MREQNVVLAKLSFCSSSLTKVNENTLSYELPIYREATTDNINREVTLLRERQINWTKEIENMETKIKDLIVSLDLTQEIINETKLQNQNKIKNDEERNVREWNKHLDYLMNIYNKEQNDDNVDNLLKFVGQKPEQNETTHSKNYRHHYQPTRKRYQRK